MTEITVHLPIISHAVSTKAMTAPDIAGSLPDVDFTRADREVEGPWIQDG